VDFLEEKRVAIGVGAGAAGGVTGIGCGLVVVALLFYRRKRVSIDSVMAKKQRQDLPMADSHAALEYQNPMSSNPLFQ
jgi:hypothetical protein